jgi:tetratricopeptide (TPR) repeat protein
MKNQAVYVLALGLAIAGQCHLSAQAARKYYPPGFTPPSDQKLVPNPSPSEPHPQVIIQQVPGTKQVIIKTVPVKVEKVVSKPARPRDPLLVLMDEQRYFDALRLVNARLKKTPNNVSLQMTRGLILRQQRNYPDSIAQFQSIFEKSKSKSIKAAAWNGLGWTYYQKALRDMQRADNAGFESGLQMADSAFRQANQLEPKLVQAWAGLAEVALANGQTKEAAQWVKKAKQIAPSDLSTQLAEANLLLTQNKPDDALQILYGIKKTTTRDPDVFLLLARGSLATGKVDDAIINLKQLLELVPDHTEALKLLSQSYELKMKPLDAEETLEKAIALNPMDEKSVASLLNIYDQRHEQERGTLLLKTLLRDQPGQATYGAMLLQRLRDAGDWEDVYQEGLSILGPILSNNAEPQDEQRAVVTLFSQAVYQKGRGMLDRRELLKEPAVQAAKVFSQDHMRNAMANSADAKARETCLVDRLDLLLIEPLFALPPLPANFTPTENELPTALQIAFLQGNQDQHAQWLKSAKRSAGDKQAMMQQLYSIGDYSGAAQLADQILVEHQDDQDAQHNMAIDMKQRILADQKSMQEQLASLDMLPRQISDDYWERRQPTCCSWEAPIGGPMP